MTRSGISRVAFAFSSGRLNYCIRPRRANLSAPEKDAACPAFPDQPCRQLTCACFRNGLAAAGRVPSRELDVRPAGRGCFKSARAALRYKPLSCFPVVERDFSLVLTDGTSFAAIEEAIRALGIAEVSSVDAVDLFRGKKMPEGKFYSVGSREV